MPAATEDVDGAVPVACDPVPGAWFPIGVTTVICAAQDAAGNVATPVAFAVVVAAPPPTSTPIPTSTPLPTTPPIPTSTPPTTATATSPATPLPTPAALPLPWPPPAPFFPITGSGSVAGLSAIWGDIEFPVSQEYGHTAFSLSHPEMYAYGADYGLDGRAHPGLDIGMPAGTPLYSPMDGTVKVAGGAPSYTSYGNGLPGVGELLIETDDGHQVILGHLGRIALRAGERVAAGQFVGLSSGENGDHLHLESRELQPGGSYLIVDPRKSFLIEALKEAATRNGPNEPVGDGPRHRPLG